MRPALLLSLLLAPIAIAAQETASDTLLTVAHYLDWEQASEPQISPDGAQIVYTRRWVNKLEDKWESALWIMNADGSHQRFLVKGSGARWSPDGTRIVYLAEGETKGTQVFVRWMDAEGAVTQVTRVEETPADARWSPDGKAISFAMLVPDSTPWKISMPQPPAGAKWTPAPRVVDELHYRQDRVGFMKQGFTHLFLVPAEGGTPRQLTAGHWNVGARFDGLSGRVGYDWTPDAKTLVFDGLRDTTGDDQYRVSRIYALDVATGAIRTLVSRAGYWADPTVSPDGRTVAFTGYDSSEHTHRTSDLYTIGIDGSGLRDLSRTLDRDPGDLTWAPDGKAIYFTAPDRGAINVHVADLAGGVRDLTQGAQDLRKPSGLARLTHVNDDVLGDKRLARTEEMWYGSSGGTRVQGWIVTPPSFTAGKKYPLLLEIHGGPFAMYNVGFSYMFQNFAANGYVVLFVNPRGSTGYGDRFSNGIDHDYPGPDYDDLMAGVDAVIGRGFVDTTRMYVSGCSGGGVLSSWVIGHTTRFAAAAVRCPVIDWIAMAGQTDIPLFTYSFFHQPFWEKPDEWLAHSSLMYVGHVTTPTLLMTGELDRRTPIPQTEEYYAALKMRHVPTVMLRFSDEFHGTGSKPSNFMRTQLYMLSWFEKHKAAGEAAASSQGTR